MYIWCTWKEQQNYSFNRDKIFEAEIAVSKVYTSLMNYVQLIYEAQLKKVGNSTIIDQSWYQKQIEEIDIEINKNLKEYSLAVHSLNVLNIKYSQEILINYNFVRNQFFSYGEQIQIKQSAEDLLRYYWTFLLPEMQMKRKLVAKHLEDLRLKV